MPDLRVVDGGAKTAPAAPDDERTVKSTRLRLSHGDITRFQADAMVYYARPDLQLGSGYGGAIAVRGGPAVQEEIRKLGPVPVGEAVATGGGGLPAKWIVHAVGPRFQEPDTEEKLRATTLSALRRAAEMGARTVVLPPMGTGFYGIAPEVSARVTLGAVREFAERSAALAEVTVCVRDPRELAPLRAALRGLFPAQA